MQGACFPLHCSVDGVQICIVVERRDRIVNICDVKFYKLGNLKALDTSNDGVGFAHGAKMDKIVWDTFLDKPTLLFSRRQEILAGLDNELASTPDADYNLPDSEMDKLVREIDFSEEDSRKLQKWRQNQWAFRLSLMKGYNEHCCLSGVKNPDFLVASHIVP